ncbi:hypothetical protein H5410_014885, partial [Solanum commersonii]
TSESTIAINKNIETIKLLGANDVNRYKKNYKFLHIGLVQVVVKPLYRLGLDVPLCLLLRENRYNDQNVIDTLTLNGKTKNMNSKANTREIAIIYRVYYRLMKTTFAAKAKMINTLTLNGKTKNMNSKANTREIAIIYRVYYRLMKTTLAAKAKMISNKGVIMLMEANHNHNNTFVPKMIKWD